MPKIEYLSNTLSKKKVLIIFDQFSEIFAIISKKNMFKAQLKIRERALNGIATTHIKRQLISIWKKRQLISNLPIGYKYLNFTSRTNY